MRAEEKPILDKGGPSLVKARVQACIVAKEEGGGKWKLLIWL